MNLPSLLTVVAVILEIEGSQAQLDKGLVDGLRTGDRGRAFYSIMVDGEAKVIDAGQGQLVSVDQDRSIFQLSDDNQLSDRIRAGFQVELELAVGLVPAGTYTVGLNSPNQPELRNQTPAFELQLRAFHVDRHAVTSGQVAAFRRASDHTPSVATTPGNDAPVEDAPVEETPAINITFDQAERYCRWRGARLPNEFEWEVAARIAEIEDGATAEWTASWYKPYPNNSFADQAYHQRRRVLRGRASGPEPGPRRYLPPNASSAVVGFRCIREMVLAIAP